MVIRQLRLFLAYIIIKWTENQLNLPTSFLHYRQSQFVAASNSVLYRPTFIRRLHLSELDYRSNGKYLQNARECR